MTSQSCSGADGWGGKFQRKHQEHCSRSPSGTLVSLGAISRIGLRAISSQRSCLRGRNTVTLYGYFRIRKPWNNYSPGESHRCPSIIGPSSACFCCEAPRASASAASWCFLCRRMKGRPFPGDYNWRLSGAAHRNYRMDLRDCSRKCWGSWLISNFPNTLSKWPTDESLGMRGDHWSSWTPSSIRASELPATQLICDF